MPAMLIPAIGCMFAALSFYSLGVWRERFAARLKGNHLLFFWLGWIFDTTGTTLMTTKAGKMALNFHGVTGALAIALMFGHAIWATVVLVRQQERVLRNFHQFSTLVWLLWLVPFVSGLTAAMFA